MRKLSILSLFAASAALGSAQLIVGNDQSGTASIYEVNVQTGVARVLYSSSTADSKPWGMAADNVNNVLYWNNGATLYSATYASLLSGTPTINSVGMTFGAGTVNFVGLGYNPATGRLLGTRNIATEAVYEIDPATGVASILWNHPSTFDFGGLDFDDATGTLYGLSDAGGAGLYRIDATSQTLVAPYPGGETDIDGLAVGGGRAYYVTDGPNTTQASFYVYDLASGAQVGTLASPFSGTGTFSGAAYAPALVPEPGTMIALAAGLGAIAARRRRKA
ncbi:MAG: PEP-CTERM sorting domain-containing protein [Methanoregulaceae archaeon]|nr:PEP-CTERM sorting domain-containing protein [Methanoregulaceae archaeon]